MASTGNQLFEPKEQYDTASAETQDTEADLIRDPEAVQNGDTTNDLFDMLRLGKKQEFKVPPPQSLIGQSLIEAEELQLDVSAGIHLNLHGNMGIRASFSKRGSPKRGIWRLVLGLPPLQRLV